MADLDTAYRPPFGNQCDMMYLNASLKAGPHLRTVVAHEYMHAALFSQRTLRARRTGRPVLEEEGWLDEALAHLAEDLNGFSTSNIDYRVSAFLTCPEVYQLVVDDYYTADLFRSHGSRGSTYLFLRWCADRYGMDLVTRLVHSRLERGGQSRGSHRLDVRRSVPTLVAGIVLDRPATRPVMNGPRGRTGSRSINMRAPCEEWELAGPRFTRALADGKAGRWSALGTSSHFVVVESSPTGAVEIEVAGPTEAEIQVTVVPLGADLPRLDLAVSKFQGPGGELRLRARVNERNGVPVRLSALSWEPLTPRAQPAFGRFSLWTAGYAGRGGDVRNCRRCPAAGELRSQPISLPGVSPRSGPLAVKVVGTDEKGDGLPRGPRSTTSRHTRRRAVIDGMALSVAPTDRNIRR